MERDENKSKDNLRCAELEGVDLKGAAHLTLTRLGGVIPQILDAAVEEKKDV